MKILVCFKVVRDVDYILKEDWDDVASGKMDWLYVKNIFNCYCEGALENALRLKDLLIKNNIEVSLDAITTSELDLDLFNKLLLAGGFDKVTNLKRPADYFSPIENAETIYNHIKDENYDLVLTGFENANGNNGVFPYRLASMLNFEVLNKVSEFSYDGKINITVELDDELLNYELNGKALLIFKNTENSVLRFPSLMDRLKAKNKPEIIEEIEENKNLENTILKTYRLEEKQPIKYFSGDTVDIINNVIKEVENA